MYVADIHVSEIQSEDSLAEVEATFQLPAIWFRYYSEYVYDVDLDILQTVMSLSGMELEYEVD
mgnify:CR=1 FL=1